MMSPKLFPHPYHYSWQKRLFDILLSFIGLIVLSPLLVTIAILIKFTSKGPVFFKQKRVGRNGQVFQMIKFRAMKKGAERQQRRYRHLNEADGPVFKIRNDPRFTKFGKLLAKTGLDETPQLLNVIKGEMSLVGPRPLPISEVRKLTSLQNKRHLTKPGMTSSWVVKGSHAMKFEKWMQLDRQYVSSASLASDITILIKTLIIVPKLFLRLMLNVVSNL